MNKISERLDLVKQDKEIARQHREEYRTIERAAYHKERLKVSVEEGKARAKQPRGMAGFQAGLQKLSKGIDKIAPKQSKSKKHKGPTMADVLNGPSKGSGKTMMDMRF